MNLIRLSIERPVAVTVAVLLVILAGILALTAIPVQMTPNVDSTVITVSTTWEGASPQEVEQEIVDEQEDRLKSLSGLFRMTSESTQGQAGVRLEFYIDVNKEAALREVSDKLREVPDYPDNVDEPVVVEGDGRDRDYIAWIIFECDDPSFDIRLHQDFAEDFVKPRLERVPGVSEINILGGREREVQVRVDPVRLAQHGLTVGDVVSALRAENTNVSAGLVPEGKSDVSIRTVGQYASLDDINATIITHTQGGPIRVGDLAAAVMTWKEPGSFVRSKGRNVMAINAQREIDTNVMEVMQGLRAAIDELNAPGSLLDVESRRLGLSGDLHLVQVYDQTIYIDQAINLVTSNIYVGGALALLSLILFLRSIRALGIIALAIPISVIGTFVALVALGRNLNVVSLAGIAFAVGMVVDNAIVVLENIFRHMEMGESPARAAYHATTEVWGAVLASTLTTVIVFLPVLFIREEAGQLFRDIALAVCASVLLSLVVSITVVPCAARRWLAGLNLSRAGASSSSAAPPPSAAADAEPASRITYKTSRRAGASLGRFIRALCDTISLRVFLVIILTSASVYGSIALMAPTDYLPVGNRNLVFGLMIPPPGYNIDKMIDLGTRVEAEIRPFWEAGEKLDDPDAYAQAVAQLPSIPTFDWATMQPGPPITPPTIQNYFFVGFGGIMFHGGIADDDRRVVDMAALFNHTTRSENLPGVIGFAFQAPLFSVGGSSGSSLVVNFVGDNLDDVVSSTSAVFQALQAEYGFAAVTPQPGNFQNPAPELRVDVDRKHASDLGLTVRDVGLAVQALADGAIVGDYRAEGDAIDLKVIDARAVPDAGSAPPSLDRLVDVPIATPSGHVVPLGSVARLIRTTAPQQINHFEERRCVAIEFTPPRGLALETAITQVNELIAGLRDSGAVPSSVGTIMSGSADKLTAVRTAMLGDGTLMGLLRSRMFLALLICYLLMCVLFESFLYPLVIMFSVPFAAFGGFLGLYLVYQWSEHNPYMASQHLDVLTMLGFVILIGTVVNNAILIVHQALNFMRGVGESETDRVAPMSHQDAIAESTSTRLRPILMTMLTTIAGLLPLVLMPGSGSELYRGLAAVLVGGLSISTLFTLLLVPVLFSLAMDLRMLIRPASQAARAVASTATAATDAPSAAVAASRRQ